MPRKANKPDIAPFSPIYIDTSTPPVDHERIPVFVIDGREHTIPLQLPAGDTIRALEIVATRGETAAGWFMIETALGRESLEALMACRHITGDQVKAILTKIGDIYLGQIQDLQGK